MDLADRLGFLRWASGIRIPGTSIVPWRWVAIAVFFAGAYLYSAYKTELQSAGLEGAALYTLLGFTAFFIYLDMLATDGLWNNVSRYRRWGILAGTAVFLIPLFWYFWERYQYKRTLANKDRLGAPTWRRFKAAIFGQNQNTKQPDTADVEQPTSDTTQSTTPSNRIDGENLIFLSDDRTIWRPARWAFAGIALAGLASAYIDQANSLGFDYLTLIGSVIGVIAVYALLINIASRQKPLH